MGMQLEAAQIQSPAHGEARAYISVGLHRKELSDVVPHAEAVQGEILLSLWHDRTVVTPVHSPHAIVELVITVKSAESGEQPVFASQFPIQQFMSYLGQRCWIGQGNGQIGSHKPADGCAVQLRPTLEYSKVGEFFAHFMPDALPEVVKPRWSLLQTKQNLLRFKVQIDPFLLSARYLVESIKWVHPAMTMCVIALYCAMVWYPLLLPLLVHVGVLGMIGRNYIVHKRSQLHGAAGEDVEESPFFSWVSQCIDIATEVTPIPSDTQDTLSEFQNEFGEMGDDLVEFWALFDWSDPDGDTEIVTTVTLASVVMHLVLPLHHVMLVLGAAVFLRYTAVYTLVQTVGKGCSSWRRTSWSLVKPAHEEPAHRE